LQNGTIFTVESSYSPDVGKQSGGGVLPQMLISVFQNLYRFSFQPFFITVY